MNFNGRHSQLRNDFRNDFHLAKAQNVQLSGNQREERIEFRGQRLFLFF